MKKKNKHLLYLLIIMGFVLILTYSCNRDYRDYRFYSYSETGTDLDGNVYKTVTIGSQIWMAENLKTTMYRNGDPIPNVSEDTDWEYLTTGAYCDYDNNPNNSTTYGRLYNWYAVNDIRNIAPAGWHVPTDDEWTTLITYLGGELVAGGKLKEFGTTHWIRPNKGASNESGFTALPSGFRSYDGTFYLIGSSSKWWSTTEVSETRALCRFVYYLYSDVGINSKNKKNGFSVRCIKD